MTLARIARLGVELPQQHIGHCSHSNLSGIIAGEGIHVASNFAFAVEDDFVVVRELHAGIRRSEWIVQGLPVLVNVEAVSAVLIEPSQLNDIRCRVGRVDLGGRAWWRKGSGQKPIVDMRDKKAARDTGTHHELGAEIGRSGWRSFHSSRCISAPHNIA